jgi:predicted kinase
MKFQAQNSQDKQLIMMCGLPRSGKTTVALKTGFPIVSPDAIRLALHGQRFVGQAESFVWAIAKNMVHALFIAGHQIVVLDATNGTKKRRDEWKSKNWFRIIAMVDTPKEVCIERAKATSDEEIIPVIERMAAEWEEPSPEEDLLGVSFDELPPIGEAEKAQ